MPTPPDQNANAEWITENDAHRVLARAVELDSRDALDVSLAQLRDVAREAGIGATALDRAIHELRAGELPHVGTAASARSLSTQLARFRRHAASVILFGVAMATPGDTFVPLVLYSMPLYVLYEIVIQICRAKEGRGGSPPAAMAPRGTVVDRVDAARPATDQITRRLLLRPA